MSEIKIVRKPDEKQLQNKGVRSWPIWTKEESKFPWDYDSSETCYFLEGDGDRHSRWRRARPRGCWRPGDLPYKGMSCTWKVQKAVRKHYTFED